MNKKISKILKIFDYKLFLYDFVKWTGAIPTLIYMRMKTYYISKTAKKLRKKPSLIVSNHSSYIDPIVINTLMCYRRVCCIATEELLEKKIFGKFVKCCGCIAINKENVSVKTFKKAKETFDRGHYVAIFPQGQIVKNDEVVDYKMGAVMIAYISNVPIIPIYIGKKEKWWHRQRVAVGESIDVKQFAKSGYITIEEMKEAADYIKQKENELELLLNKVKRRKDKMSNNVFEKYSSPENFKKLVGVKNVPLFLDKIYNEYPKNIAVKTNDGNITYEMLYSDAKSICSVLAKNNIEFGKNVAVIGPNNYNFVKTSLATMAYGAVATLLPYQLDEKSIYGCCLKYDITLLFYDPSMEEKIQFAKGLLPNVKFVKIEEFDTDNDYKFNYNVKDEDPACIVLTGGTTGKSKGAILSHKALMKGTLNGTYGNDYIFNQVYYSIMPLTHVFGFIRNLMTSLYTGSMIFFNEDKKNMFKEMQMIKPTILVVVPALAELFLNLVKQFGLGMLGGNVKVIICGGASVSPYLVTEFRKLGVCFCPGYGLTELANLVSGNPNGDKPTSVGLLYPNQETKIVDGELWIKGDNLMNGYYNEPEENKNAFEDGWFKTGDLVRFDEEGYLYITGRIKDIIVLSNGENVSPAYIEDKINELPFIQDSQVYEDKNDYGAEILTAEVILRKNVIDALQVDDLQKFLESEINKINIGLMNYERVSNIVIRDVDFPRSPSMKIIRKKSGVA